MSCEITPKPVGRPREFDRKDVANKLLEWAKKEDSINLCKFCSIYLIPPRKISTWAKEDDEFRETYELAKTFLGARREEWLNAENLHVKGYDLNSTTYDFYLKEEKMEMAKHQASLNAESEGKHPQVLIKVQHDGLGSGIRVSAEELPATIHKGSE